MVVKKGFRKGMACRLALLGPPQLLDEQGRLIPIPAKAFALAAYLLLTGGGMPMARATLRQFLWENSDAKTAATNLRKFLLRIRQAQKQFGFELIAEERDHVRLTDSLDIDLRRFLDAAERRDAGALAALCETYHGDLLEGVIWEEAEASNWLDIQRSRLRDAFATAVSSGMEAADFDRDRVALRLAARRLIAVEPYNETGHRTLMRLFADEGEPQRVRDTYRNLEERLQKELGVGPDPATIKLLHELLSARSTSAPLATLPAQPREMPGALIPSSSADHIASEFNVRNTVTPLGSLSARAGLPRVMILPPQSTGTLSYEHQLASLLIEDVTIGLCRFKAFAVVAPHTAEEVSQSKKAELLGSLNIDYVVETSLQGHGDTATFIAKLLNYADQDILWVQHFDFDPTTMARDYRELSVRIVLLLTDSIERNEIASYDTEQNTAAYHLFLAGQRCLRTLGLPSVRRARRLFKEAVSECGDYAPAFSGLARTFQREWLLMARGEDDLLREAEKLAYISRDIDPDDARGFRELGVCKLYAGHFDESVEVLSEGERRSPHFADLLNDFADAYSHTCDFPAALEKINKAIELNPLCPDHYWWTSAGANYHLERYDDAIKAMRHMRDQSAAYRLMAASYAMLGDKEQARLFVEKTKDIHPDFNISGWLSIVPIQNPKYAKHYEEGLRAAGFD